MKTYRLKHKLSLLLLSLLWITPCMGQLKTSGSNTKPAISKHPKIARTKGAVPGNVGCDLQDKAGRLWFRVSGEGVFRYDGQSFTNFTKRDGLGSNDVNAIIESRSGDILLATDAGVFRYDGKSFKPLTNQDDESKKPVSCLLEDRQGKLWMGTMDRGVYRYDGKVFANFLNNNDHHFNFGQQYQAIIDMLEDRNGNIWFCSWNRGGIWRYDGKTFTNFLPAPDYYRQGTESADNLSGGIAGSWSGATQSLQQGQITDDMIFSVSEDKAGNLWLATRRHGACRYDGKSFTDITENAGFANKGMYAILEDKHGHMWFTTEKDGVWRYDGQVFKNFTTKDGLINNSVFSILEDKNGYLWFGTRGAGLSRFDGTTFVDFADREAE